VAKTKTNMFAKPTLHGTRTGDGSVVPPAWMLGIAIALSLVGCNFETQPLFSVSSGDGGIGHGTGSTAGTTGNGAFPKSGSDAPNTPDAGSTTSIGSGDAGASCTPGQVMSCSDGVALTCRTDGLGFSGVTCGRAGCNAAGTDCYSCRAGERTCNGAELLTCDADGGATQGQSCDHGCGGAPPACLTCSPGATSCEAGQLSTCALDGMTITQSACAHGCDAARHACALTRLQPVNLSVDVCSGDDTEDRSFSGNVMIDTDGDCSFVQHQASAAEICVLRYRDIHVEVGALVQAAGTRALALVATGQFVLEGSLSVSASGPTDGAGAAHSGNGADAISVSTDPSMDDPQIDAPANAAGGGGGFAVSGGLGGDAPGDCSQSDRPCADPGAGGLAYGSVLVKPLLGGSSGGRNSAISGSTRQAAPGGAGGALQLVACGQLQIAASGRLLAAGGGGGGGTPGTVANASPTPGAGAGGGSGGAILIEAAQLSAAAGAIIAANGGGGGGGATRGGANANSGGPGPSGMGMGMMRFAAGGDGQDGQPSQDQAAGGLGARDSAPGGAGGTRLPPAAGTSVTEQDAAAGGGGGAAGRIRIEAGLIPLLEGVIVSPAPSTGAVLLVPLS
jgi:hypothetical protein